MAVCVSRALCYGWTVTPRALNGAWDYSKSSTVSRGQTLKESLAVTLQHFVYAYTLYLKVAYFDMCLVHHICAYVSIYKEPSMSVDSAFAH